MSRPAHRFALPLAVVGVFVALALTGREFDLSTLIGMPMLIDVVATHAIVRRDLVQRPRHGAAKNAIEKKRSWNG
jgi:multidrug efflux pump subunit AcrB